MIIDVLTPFLVQFARQAPSTPPQNDILESSVQQLIGQSLLLVIYVVGLVLALAFWKRSPTASICTIIGLILLLITSVGLAFLQNYFFNDRLSQQWSTADVNRAMATSSLVANVIRAGAFILILVAIFVRRSSAAALSVPDYRTMRMK